MKAIRLHSPGGPENLVYEEVETPNPGDAEALVRVHAAALTRDELDWPVDRLPAIPSYELSGTVVEVGEGVTEVDLGEPVYALTDFDRDGVAAEFAAVAAHRLAPKPGTLSHVAAAAIPLPALSAMQGLFDHGHLEQGQRVLIHGGAGGVGAFAVQLARVRGAYVIATASSSRIEAARELGAHEVIDRSADFTAIEPVNLVFDTVGGDRLIGSLSVVARGGLVVSVAERPPAGLGEGQGVGTTFFIVEPNAGQLAELATLADEGRLRVLVDGTFPLDRAREAFERSQSGETRGKVILEIVYDRLL
jgi:NADPH:quinone reductase-like Zn-dependent oxidoreductase